MPTVKSVATLACSFLLGLLCVGLLMIIAIFGAYLNRGRGGYIHIGPRTWNESTAQQYDEWYWPVHVLSRLLIALPTGILVLLVGLHLRASIVVAVLTWFSLYVGWGCYMSIGMSNNVASRSGVFDWMLGRQAGNWTMGQRFVREFSGMSLRGLVWTAPQGYLLERLGFGWEYSLCGSMMGLVYFVGFHTKFKNSPDPNFFSQGIPASEVYWGWWIWFVLGVVSLSQLVRRGRVWVYKKNPYLGPRPFSSWENIKYLSLNRSLFRFAYEIFMGSFNLILCCSLMFYSLIEQFDIRNKAQTFFGLFTGVLVLSFSQGWVWSLLFLNFKLRRLAKKAEEIPPNDNQVQTLQSNSNSNHHYTLRQSLNPSPSTAYRRSPGHLSDLDRYEATAAIMNGETQPLLSWPYSHPDRVSPTGERINTLLLPEGNPSVSRHIHHAMQPQSTSTVLLILWPILENWIWLDVFVLVRRLIGLVSFFSTTLTMVLMFVAVVWDIDSPRFMHVPSTIFILNATIPEL